MHLSLARKYRPKRFDEVAVQSHVSQTLRGAIARGRVAHGYLLCGPRGVGKTTLARVLAMALNCEQRRDGEPCGECASCRRIWSGSASLDVVEIDAASNRGVDDARDLRERAMYAPSGADRYKVYIVDEAHMLTREAWNALLKILEEPPPHVVFVFATTEPQRIAQAAAPVLSRLQRFDLRRIGTADVRTRLTEVLAAEGVAASDDALGLLARAADGSMRDALSLTDQALSLSDGAITAERVREALGLVAEDEYLTLLDVVAERRAGDVFAAVGRLADSGADLGTVLGGFADLLRAQLALTLGGSPADLSDTMREALSTRTGRLSAGDLLRMVQAATELEPRFRRSAQQQMLLEMLLVRLALLDRTISLETVLRELGGSSDGGGAAAASSPPAPAPPPEPHRPPPAGAQGQRSRSSPAASAAESPARRPTATLDAVAERWTAIVTRLQGEGRVVLAAAAGHGRPVALDDDGTIVVALPAADAPLEQTITRGASDLLGAIGHFFTGAQRVQVRVDGAAGGDAPTLRLTEESVRSERLARLRHSDPMLDAAVESLDLELIE